MHVCEILSDEIVMYLDMVLKLMVSERKILRRIYGPTKESDDMWRIKSNEELITLIGNKNVINHIKAQRLAWFGYVHRTPDDGMVIKVYE
jgi:hypothetical protein